MALTTKIILYSTLIVFFFGQLLRLEFFGISFPLIDIAILTLSITNITHQISSKSLKVKNKPFFYFLIFSWITFFINLLITSNFSASSFFYLIRLNLLISLFIFPINHNLKSKRYFKFLKLVFLANILFGIIQYIFWPDFTYFKSLNWDPHLYRLVGTFFDPTFTAQIFLSFLIFLFISANFKITPLITLTYLGLSLTYSRSTLLAFLVALFFISKKIKSKKTLIFSLLIFTSTILLLPRMPGEGTKLERTSSIQAKIDNYREAIRLVPKSPIIGIGYNNISSYRTINNPNSHANAAFDSSLLNILITTGIIGLSLFMLGLRQYFTKSGLTHQSILLALIFHSLFANSLLYPWSLLLLFLI